MADHPSGHRSVVIRRNPGGKVIGGSLFPTNRLSNAEALAAAEKLVQKSTKKLNIRDALTNIREAQTEREIRLKKRAKKAKK